MPRTDYTANLALTADPRRLRSDLTIAKAQWRSFAVSTNRQISSIGRTAAIGTAALAAGFAAATKSAADFADNIGKSARSVGSSSQEYQKLTFAITRLGGDVPATERAIRRLQESIVGLVGSSQQQVLEKLGLDLKALGESSPTDAFNELIRALAEVENKTERAAAAAAIFGSRQAKAALLAASNYREFIAEQERAAKIGAIVGDRQIANAEAFNDALTDLSDVIRTRFANAVLNVGIRRGEEWNTILREIGDGIETAIGAVRRTIGVLYEFRDVIGIVAGAWAALWVGAKAVAIVAGINKAAGAILSLTKAMRALTASQLISAITRLGAPGLAILGIAGIAEAGTSSSSRADLLRNRIEAEEGLLQRDIRAGLHGRARARSTRITQMTAELQGLGPADREGQQGIVSRNVEALFQDINERIEDAFGPLPKLADAAAASVSDLGDGILDLGGNARGAGDAGTEAGRAMGGLNKDLIDIEKVIRDAQREFTDVRDVTMVMVDEFGRMVPASQLAVEAARRIPSAFEEAARDAAAAANHGFRNALSDALSGEGSFRDIGKAVIQSVRRSISDSIADRVTEDVFKPVSDSILNGVLDAFKGSSGGFFDGIGRLLEGGFGNLINNLGSVLNRLFNSLSGLFRGGIGGGGGLGGLINSIGGLLGGGSGGGGLFSGLLSTLTGGFGKVFGSLGTSITSALGGIGSAISAALPYVGIGLAVFSAFRTKTKLLDSGIRVTIDGVNTLVEEFAKVRKSRFFGLSSRTRQSFSRASEELASPILQQVQALRDGVKDAGAVIGVDAKALAAQLDGFSKSFTLSLKGLSDSQKEAKLQEAFEALADDFAALALSAAGVEAPLEKASETLLAIAQEFVDANTALAQKVSSSLDQLATEELIRLSQLSRAERLDAIQQAAGDVIGQATEFLVRQDLINQFTREFLEDTTAELQRIGLHTVDAIRAIAERFTFDSERLISAVLRAANDNRAIPRFHNGVRRVPGPPGAEVLAMLEAGERVIPAGASAFRGEGGAVHITQQVTGDVDAAVLRAVRRNGRELAAMLQSEILAAS